MPVDLSKVFVVAISSRALYDLDEEKVLQAVNLSLDIRESVHSIAVWPYKWPTS